MTMLWLALFFSIVLLYLSLQIQHLQRELARERLRLDDLRSQWVQSQNALSASPVDHSHEHTSILSTSPRDYAISTLEDDLSDAECVISDISTMEDEDRISVFLRNYGSSVAYVATSVISSRRISTVAGRFDPDEDELEMPPAENLVDELDDMTAAVRGRRQRALDEGMEQIMAAIAARRERNQ